MKEKDVHFIERHVEKLILGVACVFLLVVMWLFVLGQPYIVKVASQDKVPPSRVNEMVLQAAKDLGALVGDQSTSPLKEIPVPQYTELFRERLAVAPGSAEMLDPLANPGLADMGRAELVNPQPIVAGVPTPSAPEEIQAVWGFGVLPDREQLSSYLESAGSGMDAMAATAVAEAYGRIVDESAPRDFRYVSVAAVMDMAKWRELLKHPADGGEAIPESWWRGALLLTGVQLERQEINPISGEWTEPVVIDGLPGSVSVIQDRDAWIANEAELALNVIREKQAQIIRPAFPPMPAVVEWVPPIAIETMLSSEANPEENTDPSSEASVALVPVWSHDLTVKPEGVYRYRLTVRVYNPLFRQDRVTEEQKGRYYNVFGVASEPSVWSDPIRVPAEMQYFIVGGSRKQQTARVEVWRVFNGVPRVMEFVVSPGDPVGSVASLDIDGKLYEVSLQTGEVMVDLLEPAGGLSVDGAASMALFMDRASGELRYRDIADDINSMSRRYLRESAGQTE